MVEIICIFILLLGLFGDDIVKGEWVGWCDGLRERLCFKVGRGGCVGVCCVIRGVGEFRVEVVGVELGWVEVCGGCGVSLGLLL